MKTICTIVALIGAFIAASAAAQQLLSGPGPGETEKDDPLWKQIQRREEADDQDRRAKCGRDFQRVQLGMQIARVSKCTWPAHLVGASETPNGRIYIYRMSRTRITTDAKGRIIQIFQ